MGSAILSPSSGRKEDASPHEGSQPSIPGPGGPGPSFLTVGSPSIGGLDGSLGLGGLTGITAGGSLGGSGWGSSSLGFRFPSLGGPAGFFSCSEPLSPLFPHGIDFWSLPFA